MDDVSRRAAEEGVCLLAVLDAALDHLGCVEQIQGDDLAASLSGMLNKQRYTQVITAGCQLLCTLARMHATAAAHVTHLADRLYKIAATLLSSEQQAAGTPEPAHLHHAPRCVQCKVYAGQYLSMQIGVCFACCDVRFRLNSGLNSRHDGHLGTCGGYS